MNQEARHNLSHPDHDDDENQCNVNVDDVDDELEKDDLAARSLRSCQQALRQRNSDEKKELHFKHRLKL